MKQIDEICVEKITRILGDLVTGNTITELLAKNHWKDHDTESKSPIYSTKWRRLKASMIYEINRNHAPTPFFKLIEEIMNPASFSRDEQELWNCNLTEINFTLSFYGYELNDAGKVVSIKPSTTFNEAFNRSQNLIDKLRKNNVHEKVILYCTPELLDENYFHAILEASKSVLERIRELTNSTLDGNTLINEAFKAKNPAIVIHGNLLENDNDKSQYLGLKSLLNTICYFYRNPTAHSPKMFNEQNEDDAITAFLLISMAHQKLDNCFTVRFLD
ncbi:TIGR02391 family protein [Lysinibacillus piscis]|uniref:Conserved hypothetical protein CHP02391 domain-containing protein n=1 Tax=Lysinibacillus piscis TaxID=2518931 RepID=A0ABQ5NJW1_9BACI|nr:TIGR02391 family protein [Lysinibacillus sp. KH24]GLC88659.1 hypothetical protein LYSBPC_17860 [Lysinibacillus sp. KH24]